MAYTLGQAAKAVGRSKPTLLEAIKKGRFSAVKDELGRYAIDPAELHRVYPPIGSNEPETELDLIALMAARDIELNVVRAELKALTELKERIERECEDLREDRDHWRLQARALPAGDPAPLKGFFRRLFGG